MPETTIQRDLPKSDVMEDDIRTQMPHILEILLLDRTTSTAKTAQNIIWANDNYKEYGLNSYAATAQIRPELITGKRGKLIIPRALKTAELQKKRTKTKAEVFTPTWIVKKQNDAVDADYKADDLEAYTRRKWLEITCGEAPYMATRYDMGTGEVIPISERAGFVDRKLARINAEVTDKAEWQRFVELAYKASYGFEWNGDSLLLARENLLYTYRDYYIDKWDEPPFYGLFEEIAKIISYNVFQIIIENCQDTVFGGFAPNSESAEILSKVLGNRTIMTGSVSRGRNDLSQSLQMTQRSLMMPDELKSMPKGHFIISKTGAYPMRTRLMLFLKWGIIFGKPYEIAERSARKVSYADRCELEDEIIRRHAACEDVPDDAEAGAVLSGGILHTPVQEPEHQAAPKQKAPVRI